MGRSATRAACAGVVALLVTGGLLGTAAARTLEPRPATAEGGPEQNFGLIRGTVVDAADARVPEVAVRLREVVTGRVIDVKRTGADGVFTFEQVPPGQYVVEVLDDDGGVMAVGQPVTVSGGSPVSTLLRLRSRVNGTSVFFSNAAAAIVAAAAAIGFAAVAPTGQAVSPER